MSNFWGTSQIADGQLPLSDSYISQVPSFTFTHPDGREAVIDFGKDGKVSYSGELPVDESAKLFFEAFGNLIVGALRKEHED
jgi:hypothetical protein